METTILKVEIDSKSFQSQVRKIKKLSKELKEEMDKLKDMEVKFNVVK